MSAIYGCVGQVDADLLEAMGTRLSHRGPHTLTSVHDTHIALGERLPARVNPLVTNEFAVVADAAIYNLDELHQKLAMQGYTCQSDRAEEVLLQGYATYGPAICEHLNGDFAFAVWDFARSRLFLARDAVGTRPLYYWHGGGRFAFASEYKALLVLPFVPAQPDRDAIQLLQYTKYPPADHTLLQDIVSVPAGSYLEYDLNGICQVGRYWTIQAELIDIPEAEHAQSVREHFLAAVERRIGNRSEIGATLSGGVDSAAVVAAIRRVRSNIKLHTFTCGYGPEDPEIKTAAITAEAVGAIHHPLYVTPVDIPQRLPKLVWHLEDPIARSETVYKYETAKVAAEYVDVVLAGYASDGLYAGMPKHKIIRMIQWLPWFKTPLEEFYNYTQVSIRPASVIGRMMQMAYFRNSDSPPPEVIGATTRPNVSALPRRKSELLNEVLKSGVVYGVPKWLPKAERLHMAHGLEVRSPFIDVTLIHQAFQIPDKYKIKGWREKHIFREAVQPLLPPEVLNRPKFPQAMKYDKVLSDVLERITHQILSPEAVQARGFFDTADIDRLLQRRPFTAYSAEQSMRLWTAILTELWARIYVDNRGTAPVAEDFLIIEGGSSSYG